MNRELTRFRSFTATRKRAFRKTGTAAARYAIIILIRIWRAPDINVGEIKGLQTTWRVTSATSARTSVPLFLTVLIVNLRERSFVAHVNQEPCDRKNNPR